jgi:membrane protein
MRTIIRATVRYNAKALASPVERSRQGTEGTSDSTLDPIEVGVEVAASVTSNTRRALGALWGGVVGFTRSSNLTFASSIAYYSLLSIFPFVLLILSVFGRFAMASNSAGTNLLEFLGNSIPSRFEFLMTQLESMARAPLRLSVAGTLITLWASMGVFGAITSAVNHAWGVDENYGFWKHKLVAFLMMLAAGLLAVLALSLIGAAQVVEARWFADVLTSYPELRRLSGVVYRNLPTPLFIMVVGLIYYFIPNTAVRLRDVWFGAIVAGGLWRLAFAGFSWYVRDFSRFTVHGSVGAVVAFLVWIYLSAIILLYGVEVTVAWTRWEEHERGQTAD